MAVYKDSSIEKQTLQRQSNARQINANTIASESNLLLTKTYNDNLMSKMKSEQSHQLFSDIFNLTQQGLNSISSMYSQVESFQNEKAQRDLNIMNKEYQGALEKSIQDGSTYFDQDENGNKFLVLSDDVKQLADKQNQWIKDSKYMGSIKKSMLSANTYNLQASNISGYDTAYKQSYIESQEAFAYNLDQAAIKDSQTIVKYNGNFEQMLADGVVLSGTQVIEGYTYLTPAQKQVKMQQYLTDIRKQGDIETSINIARTQGSKAAYDYIYDSNRNYLTEQEKQSMYSSATKSLSQAISTESTKASSYMRDAMIKFANGDASITARDVYESLAKMYQSSPKEVQQAVMDSAHTEQVNALNELISATYNMDIDAGYDELVARYKEFENGVYDDYFINADALKIATKLKYKNAIDTIETNTAKELNVSVNAIKSANTATVKEYNSTIDNIYKRVENGTLSPKDAITEIATAQSVYSSMIQGDKNNKSVQLSSQQINIAAQSLVNKLTDTYIPAELKTYASNRFNILLSQINMPSTDAKRKTEQKEAYLDLETMYYGKIAEYIFENGTGASRDQIEAFCDDLASSLAIDILDKNFNNITTGTLIDEPNNVSNAKATMKDAMSFIDTAYKSTNVVYENQSQSTRNGEAISYTWITPEAKQQAELAAGWTATQISYITNENASNIAVSWVPTRVNGEVVAVPQVYSSGYYWRVGPSGFIEYLDGATWQSTNIKPATTAEKLQSQYNNATIPNKIKKNIFTQSEPNTVDVPSVKYDKTNEANIISGNLTAIPIVLNEEQQKAFEDKILEDNPIKSAIYLINNAKSRNELLNIQKELQKEYQGNIPNEIKTAITKKSQSLAKSFK